MAAISSSLQAERLTQLSQIGIEIGGFDSASWVSPSFAV
jgi:hypothetical protein